MAYLERDGVRIHYDVRGQGETIILSHGFAATSRMFEPNIDALAQTHTVVTWDLRGHGSSDAPPDPGAYSVSLCVEDIAALLDHVGTGAAVVAGHSLGGYLSLEFQLAHPTRVAGLVLIDTGPGYRKAAARAQWNEMAERYARRLEQNGLGAIADSEELRADSHRNADGLVHAARHILPQNDARVLESLAEIRVPTLVVVGEDDEAFVPGARYMAAKIPEATLEIVAGARHAPNVTHAARFNEIVTTFLRQGTDGATRTGER